MINFDDDSDKHNKDNDGVISDNNLNNETGEEDENDEDDVDSWELESDLEE